MFTLHGSVTVSCCKEGTSHTVNSFNEVSMKNSSWLKMNMLLSIVNPLNRLSWHIPHFFYWKRKLKGNLFLSWHSPHIFSLCKHMYRKTSPLTFNAVFLVSVARQRHCAAGELNSTTSLQHSSHNMQTAIASNGKHAF